MNKGIATLVLLGSLALSGAAPSTAAEVEEDVPDTLVFVYEAGPQGAEGLKHRATYRAERRADQNRYAGIGTGTPQGGGHLSIFPDGGGRLSVTTTRELGGHTLVDAGIEQGAEAQGILTVEGFRLAPHAELAVLFFNTGTGFPDLEVGEPTVTGGAARLARVLRRHGAGLLEPADPANAGAAVGAGPVAAGHASLALEAPEGIVGGIVTQAVCLPCAGRVIRPDGTSRHWYQAPLGQLRSGEGFVFAGPPGPWTFTWEGAGGLGTFFASGSSSFGAYAPVADLWDWFERP